MAVQKNIIKNDNMKAIVHVWGDAGDSSTVALTDLINSHQTTSGTLRADIAYVYCNASDATTSSIKVYRGEDNTGTIALEMHGVSEYPGGYALPSIGLDNSSSVHIVWETSGMLVMDLRKNEAYVSPNYNIGV